MANKNILESAQLRKKTIEGSHQQEDLAGDATPAESFESTRPASSVVDALLSPQIGFVLVKGEPGAGKTTFALELLRKHGRGLYISTRVSKNKTTLQHPGLADLVRDGRVSEMTLADASTIIHSSSGNRKKRREKIVAEFEDFRLASVEDVLLAVLVAKEKIGDEPLVVLDSWDAIAKRIDPVERMKVEQSLLTMAEANNLRLLFVSEEPSLTTTDYLVDAVVVLEDDILEGRRIRRAVWKKLRGSEIPQRAYPYTLHQGKFRMFEQTRVLWPEQCAPRPFAPIKNDSNANYYSTGSADLDDFFEGGLRKGATILLELGRYLASSWHIPLVTSIGANFLANGGCVFVVPPPERPPQLVKEGLANYVPGETLSTNLRIGYFQRPRNSDASNSTSQDPCFLGLDNKSVEASAELLMREVASLKGDRNRPCFFYMSIDALEKIFGREILNRYGAETSKGMKASGDITMNVMTWGSSLTSEVSNTSDIHLRLEEVDRTLLLYSVKPPSILYHVGYDYSAGYPKASLTPIV